MSSYINGDLRKTDKLHQKNENFRLQGKRKCIHSFISYATKRILPKQKMLVTEERKSFTMNVFKNLILPESLLNLHK